MDKKFILFDLNTSFSDYVDKLNINFPNRNFEEHKKIIKKLNDVNKILLNYFQYFIDVSGYDYDFHEFDKLANKYNIRYEVLALSNIIMLNNELFIDNGENKNFKKFLEKEHDDIKFLEIYIKKTVYDYGHSRFYFKNESDFYKFLLLYYSYNKLLILD